MRKWARPGDDAKVGHPPLPGGPLGSEIVGMAVDGASLSNLQGANVRQVLVQSDAAAQTLTVRNQLAGLESPVRPVAHLGERIQVEKNQNIGEDLFVQKQDDQQEYNAGDALNGNGKGDPRRRRRSRKGQDGADAEASEGDEDGSGEAEWSELGDPREAQERLLRGLSVLTLVDAGTVFGSVDRQLLSGLLLDGSPGRMSGALNAYRKQTVQIQPGPETFRMAVQGAVAATQRYAAEQGPADREAARKLVSVARQGLKTESAVGSELASFLDEALLEVSLPEARGALRAVTLLSVVENAISLWRESLNVGTVLPWSLR